MSLWGQCLEEPFSQPFNFSSGFQPSCENFWLQITDITTESLHSILCMIYEEQPLLGTRKVTNSRCCSNTTETDTATIRTIVLQFSKLKESINKNKWSLSLNEQLVTQFYLLRPPPKISGLPLCTYLLFFVLLAGKLQHTPWLLWSCSWLTDHLIAALQLMSEMSRTAKI